MDANRERSAETPSMPRGRCAAGIDATPTSTRRWARGFATAPMLPHAVRQSDRRSLNLVVIDLGDDDEAQVIFETLNARGTPLLPADLVKNYPFMPQQRVRPTWTPSMRLEALRRRGRDARVKQGRFFRPQIDLFLQH